MVYACLIVILASITGTKVCHNEPIILQDNNIDKRIKSTLGITGLYFFKVLIDRSVWHLDVGLSYPGVEADSKGSAVRRLKWYMSWV